ncbi:terminase [Psychrobacillus phage Perkons]|nr:terminase [Psychrobacillus phage Perkons]
MANYKNFQSDNFKFTKGTSRDFDNPEFNSQVKVNDHKQNSFEDNFDKWLEFVQWARWFPDLFYDLIKPESGGMRLDLDQRLFLRCMSRFISTYGVFPRGFGKCQVGDTILFTENGMKELGSYFNYQNDDKETYITENIKLLNRYGKLESTNAGVYSGYKETRKILTEEGFEVENTLNHPMLVLDKDGELVWKKSMDIIVGDYVPISRKNNVFGTETKINIQMEDFLDSFSKSGRWKVEKVKCNTLEYLDEELALIIGYLIGDGGLTRDNKITFTSKDDDMVASFKSFFENRLGVKVVKATDIDYVVNGMFTREYFRRLGLSYGDSYKKFIPEIIMSAPKNIVANFIKGLFDTDGGISNAYIEYCTASEKLSKQVQTVLLNFGIISTRTKKYNKKFKTYSYCICIFGKDVDVYNKEIGFSCERKQLKLNEICSDIKRNANKDVIPFKMESIKKLYQDVKKDNPYLYDKLYHVMKGSNQLTYEKLDMILKLNNVKESSEYTTLNESNELGYFYSKITNIEEFENHVYDLSLPETHSFIANGFISHNTMIELMSIYHTCIFFPDITMSMSAQTKENATSISEEKHKEIMKWFPLMKNELSKEPSFTKDSVEVEFKSGAVYSILANSQTSKGQRRRRLNVEESALLDNTLFKDALEPVVNVPRRTIGKLSTINPYELNGMINYVTTSGYRGSDEFNRIQNMLQEMAELKGKIVLGASWELPCHYGRGETRTQLLAKKNDPTTSSTAFAMNYESRWVGATDGALINISKLLKIRTIDKPELECPRDKKGNFELNEYVFGIDVARSSSQSNNKTAIVILRLIRNKTGTIRQIQAVNIVEPPNGLSFKEQSIIVKQLFYKYGGNLDLNRSRVKVLVVDGNVIGKGLIDRLLEDVTDPETNAELGCFDTINTDQKPDVNNSPQLIYDLTAQGINGEIIRTFIDYVETEKLKLLKVNDDIKGKSVSTSDNGELEEERARKHTQFLIDEVSNLKLKSTKSSITVEQVQRKIDKDRYSALAYALYYIFLFMEKEEEQAEFDPDEQYILY